MGYDCCCYADRKEKKYSIITSQKKKKRLLQTLAMNTQLFLLDVYQTPRGP